MIIYLVRHAESVPRGDLSEKEKDGIGLSEFGKLQATASAKKLKKFRVEYIYSSPLARAKETAEIISMSTGVGMTLDDRLAEFATDMESKDPNYLKSLKADAYRSPDNKMPAGESLTDAVARFGRVLDEISRQSFESVCVVTHRVIMESFLAKYFGTRPTDHEWMVPAGITALETKKDGKTKILFCDKKFRDLSLALTTLKRKLRA
jgi:broad specificity phosphatase PhoE